MGHKVKPQAIRIGKFLPWHSIWFKKGKDYKNSLIEDLKMRQLINKKFDKSGISNIKIERDRHNITIIIETSRPGIIIGKGGENIDRLRREIIEFLQYLRNDHKTPIPLKIEIVEIKKPEENAQLLADEVALAIERRVPYRRAMKQALNKINLNNEIKGIKIKVSGRLDGNEIGNQDWLIKGKVPTSTIKANIDYGESTAYCRYGTVGVKVFIYKDIKNNSI